MGKYYTIFDIISGLRPEYIKTKKDLEDLKRFVEVATKEDIRFSIQTHGYINPIFLYQLRRTGLLGMLMNGDGKIGRFIPHVPPKELEKYGNIYSIPDKFVHITNEVDFSNGVDKILNSEFAQNINFKGEIGDLSFFIDSGYISLKYGSVNLYYSVSENFTIKSSEIKLLSYEIPQSELPDYHVEMIEKNKSLKKIK